MLTGSPFLGPEFCQVWLISDPLHTPFLWLFIGEYQVQSALISNYNPFLVWPGGKLGDVNPAGIMFYNKIIDNLLIRGNLEKVLVNPAPQPHFFLLRLEIFMHCRN